MVKTRRQTVTVLPKAKVKVSPCSRSVRKSRRVLKKSEGQDKFSVINEVKQPLVVLTDITKTTKAAPKSERETRAAKVILKKIGITSPTVNLRLLKAKNYAETSLEISKTETKLSKNKVPVYKRELKEKVSKSTKKCPSDLYQFDSDSEESKNKKQRGKANDSSSDEYNKTIENILRNVMKKVKNRKQIKKVNNNNGKLLGKDKVVVSNQIIVGPKTRSRITVEKIDQLKPTRNGATIKIGQSKKRKLETPLEVDQPKTRKLEVEQSRPGKENTCINLLPSVKVDSTRIDEDHNDLSFGFESSQGSEDNPELKSKINVISDICLKTGNQLVLTPSKFRKGRPNANSTMCGNVLTPWRFNEINIIRKPYFLSIKQNSSLPSLRQEMVMDHTIVDHLDNLTTPVNSSKVLKDPSVNVNSQTPRHIENTPKKKLLQKTLTDFFSRSPNKENKENESVMEQSLFDNDYFSPIKNQPRTPAKVDTVKRKILGNHDVVANRLDYVSTPVLNKIDVRFPDVSIIEKSNDYQKTYFGFDSASDDENQQETPKKQHDEKPYRLSVSFAEKKYVAKKKVKINEEIVAPPVVNDNDEISGKDDDSDASDVENHEVGLFEDFDNIESLREKRTKKGRRFRWLPRDDYDKPKVRRKDVRTKKEEEDAEKWAAEFNSMCKEVEDFPLEIE